MRYPGTWPGVVDGDGAVFELMEVDGPYAAAIYLRARPIDWPGDHPWHVYVALSSTPLTPTAARILRRAMKAYERGLECACT